MRSVRSDQAEGLRRLLARTALRVVTLLSGKSGVGKTTAAVNLACALARGGHDVLLIDENSAAGSGQPGSGNIGTALGLKARYDLAQVIAGDASLEQALLPGPCGIRVLPAARAAQALPLRDPAAGVRLIDAFAGLAAPVDYVLIDCAGHDGSRLGGIDLGDSHDALIVLSRAASSITEAYALIKRLNQQYGERHFHVLVNRVASEREALTIYRNMAQVARGYLAVTLDFIGFVPPDEKLWQAHALSRALLELFPNSQSAASFRQLALTVAGWPAPQGPAVDLPTFAERLAVAGRLAPASMPLPRVSNFK